MSRGGFTVLAKGPGGGRFYYPYQAGGDAIGHSLAFRKASELVGSDCWDVVVRQQEVVQVVDLADHLTVYRTVGEWRIEGLGRI